MPTQSIMVQVGQCGNQIGHQFWKMAYDEYQLYKSESLFYCESAPSNLKHSEKSSSKIPKARAVLIDMEESVINKISNHKLNFYNPSCRIVDQSGAGNNWAVGYHEYWQQHQHKIEEALRTEAEKCDYLSSIFLLNSTGGGTGSGLGSAVASNLRDMFPEPELFSFPVYPNKNSNDVITSPYNSLLTTNALQSNMNCVIPFDNFGLENHVKLEEKANFDTANKYSRTSYNSQGHPILPKIEQNKVKMSGYDKINNVIAKCILDLTAHSRYKGPLNVDINELYTNLVPFKNLNYLTINSSLLNKQSIKTSFSNGFTQNLNSTINLKSGIYLANCALLRSKTHNISDLRNSIKHIDKNMKFPNWNLDGWKIGLTSNTGSQPGGQQPAKYDTLTCLTNSTASKDFLQFLQANFKNLYKRKAHLHHYSKVDGFELEHFKQAVENVGQVVSEYQEIENTWQNSIDFNDFLKIF